MSVVKTEAYFNSTTGVNRIRTLIWRDEDKTPAALFQIAHGVSEHIGRYDEFARFLAEKGFVVFGNDHIGHGKSVDSQDDLGYTCEKDGHRRFVDDMHVLTGIMKKRYPGLPLFLLGHSMGSFCAMVYASAFAQELAGLIICGTGSVPELFDFVPLTAAQLAEKFGTHTINSALTASVNKAPSLMIPNCESDLDWLSVSRDNIDAYQADPLCGHPLTLAGVRDLVSIAVLASDKRWAYTIPYDLPIMMISGALDPIGFNGKGVLAVADKLEMTGHAPEVILYPGMRHEILNEDCRDKVYTDIYAWLTKQLA